MAILRRPSTGPTPLTTVASTLEAMALHPQMEAEARERVTRNASDEAKRMTKLIDSLLTLAAYDSGRRVTSHSPEPANSRRKRAPSWRRGLIRGVPGGLWSPLRSVIAQTG